MEPCLRQKKRYIIVEIKGNKNIRTEIIKEGLKFFGEKGFGEIGFMIPYREERFIVARVSHKKVNEFKLLLGLIKTKCKTIKTTSTLKKAKKIIKEYKNASNSN